jgi:hypothetical protein
MAKVCKIVDEVAGAGNQDIFIAQRRKPLANVKVKCSGLGLVDAGLYDRKVGFWLNMPKY